MLLEELRSWYLADAPKSAWMDSERGANFTDDLPLPVAILSANSSSVRVTLWRCEQSLVLVMESEGVCVRTIACLDMAISTIRNFCSQQRKRIPSPDPERVDARIEAVDEIGNIRQRLQLVPMALVRNGRACSSIW